MSVVKCASKCASTGVSCRRRTGNVGANSARSAGRVFSKWHRMIVVVCVMNYAVAGKVPMAVRSATGHKTAWAAIAINFGGSLRVLLAFGYSAGLGLRAL